MMDEFKKEFIEALENRIGFDKKIVEHEVRKNNGKVLHGLTIQEPDCNISPTYYLEGIYEEHEEKGTPIEELADHLFHHYTENRDGRNFDISFFTDFDKVKDHIIYKLVNYDSNKDFLDTVPHRRYLDLAIVFVVTVSVGRAGGVGSIQITNEHLRWWGVTIDDIEKYARINTPSINAPLFKSMESVLEEILPDDANKSDYMVDSENAPFPIYILTNKEKVNGASCILYPNLLKYISEKTHADLYVIPSSIHETLIVPIDDDIDASSLTTMIKEVNVGFIDPTEVLSDHPYFFSREDGVLRAA